MNKGIDVRLVLVVGGIVDRRNSFIMEESRKYRKWHEIQSWGVRKRFIEGRY